MSPKHLLLSSLILCILFSCGTRKAKIDNYKVNVVTEEKSKLKVDSSSNENTKTKEKVTVKQEEQKDITQKDVKIEVKEIFNKDGQLAERTTTTISIDKTDKSKMQFNTVQEKDNSTVKKALKKIDHTATTVIDSLIKTNSRNVDADTTVVKNIGGWPVLLVIVVLGLGALWLIKRR